MHNIHALLDIFGGYRMAPTPLDQYDSIGKEILASKMEAFTLHQEPIHFVLLGFPFKSTNTRDKVIGRLPDLGEEASLNNFARFNEHIRTIYAPGVNVTIVSDGYVFNDLLGVDNTEVEAYKEVAIDMGRHAPITWYDLQDFYSGHDLNSKRDKVVSQFGVTPERLQQSILLNPDVNFLYRGMTIFMMEELAPKGYPSNNQLQKAAKLLTREMMFRNEAYSNLIRAEFPNHIRLSMHPSVNNGAKYSFKLIPGEQTRHSAWHSAVLFNQKTYQYATLHKKDAEAAGYQLIHRDGRPYHYITE